MLLDLENEMILLIPLLVLIGACLVAYGKEIYKVTTFFIGAIAGGVLAYMVLEGLLGPYGIPLLVQVLIALVVVFLSGLIGQGASSMVVAFLSSLTLVDLFAAFLPDDLIWISYVAGTLTFVLVLIIVQKFLNFFTALTGGIIIAVSLHPLIDWLGDTVSMPIQVILAVALGTIGYFIQRKLEAFLKGRKEEIVWVPTPPKNASRRSS